MGGRCDQTCSIAVSFIIKLQTETVAWVIRRQGALLCNAFSHWQSRADPWIYTRYHDDVIKWKPFPRHWPFVRGIHRYPVNSPHKGQWRVALMFSFICTRINGWVNNCEAGDLRRHRAHYDVTVMIRFVANYCGLIPVHFILVLRDYFTCAITNELIYKH